MSGSLGAPLTLRQTNVSNPSIIRAKHSQQSIAASEDYYSLSGSAASEETGHKPSSQSDSDPTLARRTSPVSPLFPQRSNTPPERYGTPLQSTTQLHQPSESSLRAAAAPQHVVPDDAEMRKTPMRGEGKRRSTGYTSDTEAGGTMGATAATALRVGGVRRKPVPSTVMESPPLDGLPASHEYIDPDRARSSVLGDIEREGGGASPDIDDTPYIRFAIDQLTRDEEVKGSRVYPHGGPYDTEEYDAPRQQLDTGVRFVNVPDEEIGHREHKDDGRAAAEVGGLGALAALGLAAREHRTRREDQTHPPTTQWPTPARPFDERAQQGSNPPPLPPPPDNVPNVFIPVSNINDRHRPLDFLPGILRPLQLTLFLLYLLAILALLLLCAVWSLTHDGIFNYGYFGDAKYFVFEYLPTILGILLFLWLVQIEVAVYRIAPFIAMASESSERSREEGPLLLLSPKTFFLPYLLHFRAQQPVIAFFMLASWLQIFTIPLIATSFNVRSPNKGAPHTFRWLATAGAIWPTIGLYVVLLISVTSLLFWLLAQRRRLIGTGLKWDPRSLADLMVLLERSNALTLTQDEELRLDAPTLGYWRTTRSSNDVFHSYGIPNRSARMYSVQGGRIRESTYIPHEPKSRGSGLDEDPGMGREQRHSREKMLPKYPPHFADEEADALATGGRAVPWFLKPIFASLWILLAVLLLLAFLIVSYLSQTRISNGFLPLVPSLVSTLGFSGTNFVYSFVPAAAAMICYLALLDIDYAHRRLKPYTTLLSDSGASADRSLLLSYTAEAPLHITISALSNGHMRIALLSLASLLSLALPILAGGVFFAQFNVPTQRIRIFPEVAAYYALVVFAALYAAAIIIGVFPSKGTRTLDRRLPLGNRACTFRDAMQLVRTSRVLDDVAFRAVESRTDLVTRLLSAEPARAAVCGHHVQERQQEQHQQQQRDVSASRVSLADSMRRMGRGGQQVAERDSRFAATASPRFALRRHTGRDGREYVGVDRVRP
ncbi:hypothetical protein BDY17DRAFT_69234 [Neohortaea acidophila]|uniref:Phosphoribosylaminoimidazole-succinocarboxamide synthase n=1 Tax=Neohortaea acidophila TaxID=245834 RepID=A0A6A6Q160_9PEZI|nr:uncharacterized protein BDY17DRAFT_69234 [Neohortaea acidophila]KAF2485995.1 hypothetical protein BDY17DRAFT_69234 [Neohortaea acidophila]